MEELDTGYEMKVKRQYLDISRTSNSDENPYEREWRKIFEKGVRA